MTVLGECWDDTHKSRSVIKFVCVPTLTRLFLLVAHASQRLCCFSPCLCYTRDVADRSELLLRVMRNPCLFVCARDTSVSCVQGSELLSGSFQVDPIVGPDVLNTSESSRDRLCRSAEKCDTHCELLGINTSQRVIASQIPSARVINTFFFYIFLKVVAEQELQSTECLGRKDSILAELIQLTCSCQGEQLAAVECRRHHNRQHQ